mgnify:CR=1 FL=1
MFLIGETIHLADYGLDIKVDNVTEQLLSGTRLDTGQPFNVVLSSHDYKRLLLTESVEGHVIHTGDNGDGKLGFVHPGGTVYSAKWYGKQYQWYINKKQASATAVWRSLYS